MAKRKRTPNTPQKKTVELIRDTARRPTYEGTESTAWSAPSWEDFVSAWNGEVEGVPDVADAPADLKSFAARHSLLGDEDADNLRDLVFFPVVNPSTGRLNERALGAVISGRGESAQIPESAKDSAQAIARRLLNQEYDRDLESEAEEPEQDAIPTPEEATTGLVFAELQDGKPFDGLLAGTFIDMRGQEVTLEPADLEQIATNTNALIEARKSENGEVLGLPIDAKQHDKGDAAGWIKRVDLVDGVLRIVPEWTTLGIEKIEGKIQRLFSATLDLKNKVVRGGTLTNWPAVDGLRPIELSQNIYGYEPADKPVESEEVELEMNKDELIELIGATVKEQLAGAIQEAVKPQGNDEPEKPNGKPAFDVVEFLELQGASDDVVNAFKSSMLEQYEAMKKRASMEATEMIATIRRESQMAELAQGVTAGSEDHPRGLRVSADKLKEELLALPQDRIAFWSALLKDTVEHGLVEFAELGHGKIVKAQKDLPADIAADLTDGTLTLADLRDPLMVPILGDLNEYNLSRWEARN